MLSNAKLCAGYRTLVLCLLSTCLSFLIFNTFNAKRIRYSINLYVIVQNQRVVFQHQYGNIRC